MNRILSYFAWGLMSVLAIGVSTYAATYLNFDPEFGFLGRKEEEIISRILYRVPFWIHVMGGIVALSLGPFQFLPSLRKKRIRLHRTMGKVYISVILLGGISGIPVSLMASGGWVARIGFLMLALTWLYTTGQAYLQARQGNIDSHRRWMVRSYAVTFGAVTLRLWLPILLGLLGWKFSIAYPTVAWISWVPNLLVVEWWLRRRKKASAQLSFSATAN